MVTSGEGWGKEIVREFGMGMYTIIFRMNNQKGPGWDGRGVWGRMGTCICMTESLYCVPETITTLLIGYAPI